MNYLYENEKQEVAGIIENVRVETPEEFYCDFDYFWDTATMMVWEHLRFCGNEELAEIHTEKVVMEFVKGHFPEHYISPIQQWVRSNIKPMPVFKVGGLAFYNAGDASKLMDTEVL